MTIILNCLDGLDPETFYNNIFFTMATTAITKIPLYYQNVCFNNYCKKSLKGHTFCNANIWHMSSSHQSMTMSLQQAKNHCHKVVTKYLTYFPISQIVSGKGSLSYYNENEKYFKYHTTHLNTLL